MTTVLRWTGLEARALRTALRMSIRAFAEHLGVNFRTVANWEAQLAGVRPRTEMQQALDTALAQADHHGQARFRELLHHDNVDLLEDDQPSSFHAQEDGDRVARMDANVPGADMAPLTALATAVGGSAFSDSLPDPDAQHRLDGVLENSARLDAATVDTLATLLAGHRHLDDTLPAHLLLPSVTHQWRIVSALARHARGTPAVELRRVAAEWTQFLGWLLAEARQDSQASQVLAEARDQATALDDGVLTAQAENFLGYLARQQHHPAAIVRHFLAAYHTPDASPLQRVGDAVQAAHGFALMGHRNLAERLLGEADELTQDAQDTHAPATAYWLSPSFSRLGLGLAYLELHRPSDAATNLETGLNELPNSFTTSEWATEYHQALQTAHQRQ